MSGIQRLLPTPERRFSRIVCYRDLIFLAGVTAPDPVDDVAVQCRHVLARIEELLALGQSDKFHILNATIWLADIKDFAQMNAVWDAWVTPEALPARTTIEARLAKPNLLVEIGITAARTPAGGWWW